MTTYFIRRLGHAVLVLVGVTLLVFVLQHLIASGASLARALQGPRATRGSIHVFVVEYGLDRPLPIQYLHFLWALLHGNLGYSYKLNQSVDAVLARDLPNDILLVGVSLALGIAIAIPLGIIQAVRRGGWFDHLTTAGAFVLYSMPTFWLGLLLIEIFAIDLGWLPGEATQSGGFSQIVGNPTALVLPISTLTLISAAYCSRYMRAAAIETLAEDYIRTARAKGLPERLVIRRHLIRNSTKSIVTLVGLSFPAVLTWGLAVEFVFNYPGVGLAFYNAASAGDYPLELGVIVVIGLAKVVGSLVADIGYAILDPRVRYR